VRGVFEGLKVLELGAGAAGPVATRYFAEQGARVVRVESARRPDFLRLLHVTARNRDEEGILERAPMFVLLNPGKDSVAINLKEPRGVEIVESLVAWADVVSENFAPGVMERFGLGPEQLLARNPDLILARGCLFGQTGPQRHYPGFGGQGSAIAGFNHLTGWPDAEAHGPYATITDSLAPRYVAVAIAAALWAKRRTGRGRVIDVSQIETGVYSLSEMMVRHSATGESLDRRGNADEHAVPHGVYPCAGEDRWIAIEVADDEGWARLVQALGAPPWAADPRLATRGGRRAAEADIDRELAAWTADREPYALMRDLQAAGVAAGVVQRDVDLLADPQLAARGHFVPCRHAALGELQVERSGYRLAHHPGGYHRAGPLLGEHTEEVLGEVLGLETAEIEELAAAGVLA